MSTQKSPIESISDLKQVLKPQQAPVTTSSSTTTTTTTTTSTTTGDICSVFGSTGAVGSHLVDNLLSQPEIGQVYCFTRSTIPKYHNNSKYKEVLLTGNLKVDLQEHFPSNCDVVFSSLATTIKKAGSEDNMRAIDYTMNDIIATYAHEKGVPQYYLVSSVGADSNSSLFYPRLKGELDNRIKQIQFARSVILRPGLLIGANRPEFRLGEWLMETLIAPFWTCKCSNNALGKVAPIEVNDVAKAMVIDYISNRGKNAILRQQYTNTTTDPSKFNQEHTIYDGSGSIMNIITNHTVDTIPATTTTKPQSNTTNSV